MAINLQKGQRISLVKENGSTLQNVCVGVNWGAIEKKSWLGSVTKEAVDLDASCLLFDDAKNSLDVVYFGQLKSKDGAVKHSGDDLTGDLSGDDGLDNEIITLDFSKLSSNVQSVAFVLNSYKGQDFGTIPFASIRIYEGTPSRVNEVFATYNIAKGDNFGGHVAMVMGVFYKKNGEWKFNAIGEPTRDKKLQDTVETVRQNYL
ncbi:TerD family protein [Epilithonimonas zeae]|uniref:Tellurium resistance protein TerZ n=1 Tax=Epilithonimonas zeae TaxID=1416779 RepID=A0A1N6IN52_9FLAO|nr:TerD family protein [Epilithonimonas zeae]SIO33498.1 tellurium resistance protein TerZ [Epilithonimonas zeae]